ncbi:MAG: polysaccharide deacetylase [Gemmatimonadetes bacterium]|jgi:peptidoglycan/xylan/chitin deacetylase (PgdA/CDA1 family)|nr:polysaccharide deacetylase [Gemmatimonadota bacterium]MBK9408197.1 polysaccharide deacetylase [Gemmatimonadota bacterium]
MTPCSRPSPGRSLLAAVAVVAALAPLPLRAQASVKQGWEWSTDTVMKVVHAVRAGRSLQPKRWPNGARVAVALSFDVDNETPNLRFGQPTIGELSQGQYGARVGLPRILALLDRHAIPASFFIPAMSLMIDRSQVALIKKSGRHEFAVHGWIHEMNTAVPADVERRLVQQALDTLTALTGIRPVGYRAPSWNFSAATMSIVKDLGFTYESSLMADERPYELNQNGEPTGIVELPVEWIMDDAPLFSPRGNNYASPREVAQVWIDEFDKAYEEGTLFLHTMHPHVSGHRSRIKALELLIAHIKTKPGVWFATHRAVAEYVKAQAGMK